MKKFEKKHRSVAPINEMQMYNKDLDISSVAPNEAGAELEMHRKINFGRPLHACWGLFTEYCNNSTIHGVKYFGEHRRPWAERVWWIIVFAFSIYGSSRQIMNVWIKWDQSPVISTPIWQIPFPAVTICPETKAQPNLFNYTYIYHQLNGLATYNMTEDDKRNYNAISQICDAHLHAGFDVGNKTSESDIVDILRNLSVQLDPVLFSCKWRYSNNNCDDLFSEIVTEEGICYTFNILNQNEMFREENLHKDYPYLRHDKTSDHWNLENGYSSMASLSPYPLRVLSAGSRGGLFILLPLYKYDMDYICRGSVQGFKIVLHTPSEMPRVSEQYLRVPFNQEVIVSVKPNMITTSKDLKDYSAERFFKVYTQQNCELECLANFTVTKCGCAKFSMPRGEDTPICGAMSIECYNDAEDELLWEIFRNSELSRRGQTECNCLPSCTSITYDSEISQADFDWESLFMAYDNPADEFPGVQMARLTIFFKESQFITTKRIEVYDLTDFLANCGGLLGLFMGVSFLSIVEIVYYLTIRLISNLTMRRKRKASLMKKKNPILVVRPAPDTKE